MNRAVCFRAPFEVETLTEAVPIPGPGEVLVKTVYSGISPGTEMLVYRGQWPEGLSIDASIEALSGSFAYPVRYGYSCVGRVHTLGAGVDSSWQDARVFCFHPHCGYFTAKPESLILLPDDVSFTAAVMTPNMETAVNFLMDGRPVIGENVAVVGLGIVGLLTVMLSSRMSPASLGCIEPHPVRAEAARSLGADFVVDSVSEATERYNGELARRGLPEYADLVYELSGNPLALNTAIGIAGFSARVIVGSWYGAKRAALDLGGRFHRERIRVLSSQVSTLDPRFVGRWTNRRRLATALRMLAIHPVESLVTHRFHVDHAHDAYRLLDQNPGAAIQIIFTYEDCT